MLHKNKSLKPAVSREDRPGPHSEAFGSRAAETAHLTTVPELARHLVAVLPDDYEELQFSAVVYRQRTASPWLIDIAVFGVDDEHADTELGEMIICNVGDTVGSYNWFHHGSPRFVHRTTALLTDEEQADYTPGHVAVHHCHLVEHIRTLARRTRRALFGGTR